MVDLAQLYVSAFYPPKLNQRELFKKAEELAERAVVLEPDSGAAQAVLGSVYTDTGRARLAMPHLRRAVQLSPDDPNPRNYLSIAYEAMGFWESSLVEREKAIERDPMLRGIHSGGALMLARLGQVEQAFRVAETLESGSPAWGLRVAHIYLLTGEPKRAEEVLTKTAPQEPANLVTAFKESMALAQAEQGRSEIAKQSVSKVSMTQLRRSEITVLLCAVAGEKDLLVDRIAIHPYIRNYRWLVSERRLRPYRSYPPFQKLVHEIAQEWERNLRDFGPSLPVNPPKLPAAEEYLNQQ
jgi:Flp pilus assembly protein TadD